MSLHDLALITGAVVALVHLIRKHSQVPSDHGLKFVAGIAVIFCRDTRGRAVRALEVLKIISRPGEPPA